MPLKVGIQLYSVKNAIAGNPRACLLYTSDAADEL